MRTRPKHVSMVNHIFALMFFKNSYIRPIMSQDAPFTDSSL